MKSQEMFAPAVMIHAPGCELDIVYDAVRDAAIEFCTDSLILRRVLDPIELTAGERTYSLSLSAHEEVHMILRAWYGEHELELLPPERVTEKMLRSDTSGIEGRPAVLFQSDPDCFSVHPVPSSTEVAPVLISAALCPTRSATCYADTLYNDWGYAIVDGALAILHSSPFKPYTDTTAASFRRSKFLMGVGAAKRAAFRGHAQTTSSVRLRPFV